MESRTRKHGSHKPSGARGMQPTGLQIRRVSPREMEPSDPEARETSQCIYRLDSLFHYSFKLSFLRDINSVSLISIRYVTIELQVLLANRFGFKTFNVLKT